MFPPGYFLISMIMMVLLHLLVPVRIFISYPWSLLGIVPLLAGVVFNLVADAAFKNARTTVKPFEKSSALITSGIFKLSRHPMYLGMVLILSGIAILLGSLSPTIIIVIFAILMEYIFVRKEEQMLYEQFGSEWGAYRNKVRKWI
jgi:protein-S-isoprenylcysteine O-methyltransferase Ste14